MTAKELYLYALDQATAVVVQVESEQLALPTPDTEWTVHDLLAHMLYELAWTPDLLAGRPASGRDPYAGDLLGADAIDSWRVRAARAATAVEAAHLGATVQLSYGDRSVDDYLWEAGNDQLVHAWDLGQAIGVSVVFDEVVAAALYERARERADQLAGSGLFKPPVAVSPEANIQTRLLALLGRPEDWAER